jgi:hypothetical protein
MNKCYIFLLPTINLEFMGQKGVTLSRDEAEYVAKSEAVVN